jgi:diketogulonate reductase-like aldo/keto reductase
MEENLGALDFKMNEEDMKKLYVFGKKMKFCGCRRFFGMNIMA